MKLAVNIFFLIVFVIGGVVAQGSDDIYAPAQISSSFSTSTSSDDFSAFSVAPEDSTAGSLTAYRVVFRANMSFPVRDSVDGFQLDFPTGTNVSRAQLVSLCTDCQAVTLEILNDTSLFLDIFEDTKSGTDLTDVNANIYLSVRIRNTVNPPEPGSYRLVVAALNHSRQLILGPALSNEFTITGAAISGITIRPQTDATLNAGEILTFRGYIIDSAGNEIPSEQFAWSFADGSDSVGMLSGSTLLATTPGTARVRATFLGFEAFSGLVTVLPGPVARIDLDIPIQQLALRPPESNRVVELFGPATATLFDAFGNRAVNHDILAQPLELSINDGLLLPEIIAEPSLFDSGVVDFTWVQYIGRSVQTEITGSIGGVSSGPEPVSFSGYDAMEVLTVTNEPLTTLTAGTITPIRVVVTNRGLLSPSEPVRLVTAMESGGVTLDFYFVGRSNGAVDTIDAAVSVPDTGPVSDRVVTMLIAEFDIAAAVSSTQSATRHPVIVTEPADIALVSDSIGPSTVYPGEPFELAFDIDRNSIVGSIDSARAVVWIGDQTREVFNDLVEPSAVNGTILSYEDLQAVLPLPHALPSGTSTIGLSYSLFSEGIAYKLTAAGNAVEVLDEVRLTYVTGTLTPLMVSAGHENSFRFEMDLENSYPVTFDPVGSSVALSGSSFSATTNLAGDVRTLSPGINEFVTGEIFIPMSQLGGNLTIQVSLALTEPVTGAGVTRGTDFDGQLLEVTDLPVARIIDLEPVAPNAPRVNTSQPFQMHARVANLSQADAGQINLRLTSDGNSTFDSLKTIALIPAGDTADVFFDCVAASEPTVGELFRIETVSGGQSQLVQQPALDDVALVIIQRPAELALDYMLFGTADGLVDRSGSFGLTVELDNTGQAEATDGSYRLTTGGLEFGADSVLSGSITPGRHIDFNFVAPSFDTTVEFIFTLTQVPDDTNTGERAMTDDTSFTIQIRVQSQDADLLAGATALGSNLVTSGETKDLFRLELTNRGVSSLTSVKLDSVAVELRDTDNRPINPATVFDFDGSMVFEGGTQLNVNLRGEDRLYIEFTDFEIVSGESRSVDLIGLLRENLDESFTLSLEADNIWATFSGGSQDGLPVRISTPDGRFLLTRTFVVRGKGLEESFVIQDNPFDPSRSPARFSYEIDGSSVVEFRVFTLTGEEVYAQDIPVEVSSGTLGEHEIEWNGRNNEGETVANGVYIVSIRITETGETARMKVAVVK